VRMFQNDAQACRAIRALLRSLFRNTTDSLWSLEGPTELACEYLKSSPLSHGEEVLLKVGFAFWNGSREVSFADVIGTLDSQRLELVVGLVQAQYMGAIEDWITRMERAYGSSYRILPPGARVPDWPPEVFGNDKES